MSETPNGTVVIARMADGREVDVTEGVKALYDLCTSSMDWGSQFLSVEEAGDVIRIAQTCGFLVTDQAEEMFSGYAQYYATMRRRGDLVMSHFFPPDKTEIKCLVCGRDVCWMPGYYKPEVYERSGISAGWHHIDMDQDSGHEPKLWESR